MQDDTYRQDNCIHSCIQKNLHSKLNCTIPGFYMTPMLTICNNPINASTIYEAKCLGECASKECKSTRYEVSLSRTELPRLLGSTSKTIWFDFKYRLNSYEITQVPKTTLADMLASLGGMLGIFLGSGLLSVVEILEYLIEVTIIILSDWFSRLWHDLKIKQFYAIGITFIFNYTNKLLKKNQFKSFLLFYLLFLNKIINKDLELDQFLVVVVKFFGQIALVADEGLIHFSRPLNDLSLLDTRGFKIVVILG